MYRLPNGFLARKAEAPLQVRLLVPLKFERTTINKLILVQEMRKDILRRLFGEQYSVAVGAPVRSSKGVHVVLHEVAHRLRGDPGPVQAQRFSADQYQSADRGVQ